MTSRIVNPRIKGGACKTILVRRPFPQLDARFSQLRGSNPLNIGGFATIRKKEDASLDAADGKLYHTH